MTSEDFKLLEKALKSLDFSMYFDDSDYLRFRKVFKERGFKKGQKILWRGQKGLFFFIIGKGAVSVRVMDANKQERVVASLGVGDYVGEISLLYNRPRVADCYAEDNNTLLFFLASRDFYDHFVVKSEVKEAMEKIAQSRMQATGKISSDTVSERTEEKPVEEKDENVPTLEELPEFSSLPAMDFDSLRETVEKAGELSVPAEAVPTEATQPQMEPEKAVTEAADMPGKSGEPLLELPAEKKDHLILPDMEADSTIEPFMPDVTAAGDLHYVQEEKAEVIKNKGTAAMEAATLDEALEMWAGSSFFTAEQRERIKPLFSEVHLDDGVSMDIPGSGESLFIILGKGRLLCTYNEGWCSGESELSGGHSFGDLSLVFNLDSSATVRSLGNSLFYAAKKSSILSIQNELNELRALFEARALRQAFSPSLRTFTIYPPFDAKLKELANKFKLEFAAK